MKPHEPLSNNLIDLSGLPPSDHDEHSTDVEKISEQLQMKTDSIDKDTYLYGFERGLEAEQILGKY